MVDARRRFSADLERFQEMLTPHEEAGHVDANVVATGTF